MQSTVFNGFEPRQSLFSHPMQFPDNKYKHNSTNRIDFRGYGQIHPDVNVRRKAKLGGEGIPADMLFRHHGHCYDNMLITLYDENYNGRWRENKLPPLRQWDSQTLGWLPEKTDHPLRGKSNMQKFSQFSFNEY